MVTREGASPLVNKCLCGKSPHTDEARAETQLKNKEEIFKMMYYVEYGRIYEEFESYREAEIFCGENGIPCEYIYGEA